MVLHFCHVQGNTTLWFNHSVFLHLLRNWQPPLFFFFSPFFFFLFSQCVYINHSGRLISTPPVHRFSLKSGRVNWFPPICIHFRSNEGLGPVIWPISGLTGWTGRSEPSLISLMKS